MSGNDSSADQPLFTVSEVVVQFQGDYLFDYAAFTGRLREYIASALESQFNAQPNELHRRAYTLAVYREGYTAYEDLGAFLEAFLTHAQNPSASPVERLLR